MFNINEHLHIKQHELEAEILRKNAQNSALRKRNQEAKRKKRRGK